MSAKIIAIAAQSDVDVCNALAPPSRGCDAGRGLHIVIPPDFATRIALGQVVPGCTYSRLEADSSLYVDDRVQTQVATPAVVNALNPQLKTAAAALVTKLATAVVVAGSAQVVSLTT